MNKLKNILSDIYHFGCYFAYEYWMKGHFQGRKTKHKSVLNYLFKFYKLNNYNLETDDDFSEIDNKNENIWILWWQGEENMPEVVKLCYKSLQLHKNGHNVVLLTSQNLSDYVKLPEWIYNKFDNKKITITHFSDIVRIYLLSHYGGFWVDATLFFTRDLPENLPEFYTIKQKKDDDIYASNYKWTGFFLAGRKTNPLFYKTYIMLVKQYWYKHNKLINYYILDYIIRLLYDNDKTIKKIIDSVDYNNDDVDFLQINLNSTFNLIEWNIIKNRTGIFKLSWKQQYVDKDSNGNLTYYGKILNDDF